MADDATTLRQMPRRQQHDDGPMAEIKKLER